MTMPYARIQSTSLVFAASDGRHRPASHPLIRAASRPEPMPWQPDPVSIRRRRMARGLSQDGLGGLIGVSRQAVNAWEMGTNISPDHVERLRQVLG